MGFEASKRNWERLAQADPLWAVCTDPDKRHGRWDAGAFFATGEREVEAVFSYLDGRGLRPGDYDRGLDFGCGVGRLTRALSRRLAHVVGVDVSETMIRKARELSPHLKGRVEWVVNGDADLGRFPDGSFSFVYSSIVLQHIPWPQSLAYVGEMMRVLKPGGLLVFQVPTLDRTPLVLRGLRRMVLAAANLMRVPPVGPLAGMLMEMHVIPPEAVEAEARHRACAVLDATVTNSAGQDFDGELHFGGPDRGRLVSTQFVVGRPGPQERCHMPAPEGGA
jgi:SAM-dependent methyltransferase